MLNKKGQVWIETVLYIVIGLSLIGIVLSFAIPKINQMKNSAIIDQTMQSLSVFNEKIEEVSEVGGNVRKIDFIMKTGELILNFSEEGGEIIYTLNGMSKPYTQPGLEITRGKIIIFTEEKQKGYQTSLILRYAYNMTYESQKREVKFSAAPTPYTFYISSGNDKRHIDVKEMKSISA